MLTLAISKAPPSTVRTNAQPTIEVRSLCLRSCKGEINRLEGYLCGSERERANRFHFKADYDRFVAAHGLLRLQLGSFLQCDPKALVFEYTSHGKPFVAASGIEFNLSHSGDWVLFAFTRSSNNAKIGVDIEHIRPIYDMADVAKMNFAGPEFARWQATPEWDQTEAFYRCWTRKESFIKAIGEGLSCALNSFEVEFGLHQPACLTSVRGEKELAKRWWMADLPGFADYAAAVTLHRANLSDVSLVLRELVLTEIDNADLLA